MNSQSMHPALLALPLALLLTTIGCATRSSTLAKPLEGANVAATPLADCRHLTVTPFAMPPGSRHHAIGTTFARDVETRLSENFGRTFASVEFGAKPRGLDGECVLDATITQYRPGSRAVRMIPWVGGFVGAASLKGTIAVRDGGNGEVLLEAPFDKVWMWSGIGGVRKGIEDMAQEAGARIANTVARAKGWEPTTGEPIARGSRP